MFKLTQVTGSGSAENLLTLDPLIEGSIHSILVDNATGSAAIVGFEIGGVEFNYSITGAVTTTLDVKINLPAGSAVNVTAPTGVKVVASYVEMPLDAATTLTTAQQITATAIQDVDDAAVAAVGQVSQILASVPEGTINDSTVTATSTWSSQKLSDEKNVFEGSVSGDSVTLAGAEIDCSLSNYFVKSQGANTTYTITNAPPGSFSFILEVAHVSGTIAWPVNVKWPEDEAPEIVSGKTHLFLFITRDSGASWFGTALINYS